MKKRLCILGLLFFLAAALHSHKTGLIASHAATVNQTTNQTSSVSLLSSTRTIPIHSVKKAKYYLPPMVYKAFKQLNFKVKIKSSVSYNGVFSVRRHSIILKRNDTTVFLHEMGHFTALLADSADRQKSWKKIYKQEKGRYRGRNRGYMTKNVYEYFAESFREYCVSPKTLKRNRPQTYKYIHKAVSLLDEESITTFRDRYRPIWKKS